MATVEQYYYDKLVKMNLNLKQQADQRLDQIKKVNQQLKDKERYIRFLRQENKELCLRNRELTANIQGTALTDYPVQRYNPAKFKDAESKVFLFFQNQAKHGNPIWQIQEAAKFLHNNNPKYSISTYARSIRKLAEENKPHQRLKRIREGYYALLLIEVKK